ncbi:MAG TPA: hypothetical protein VFP56_09990 [Candidatus Limnocylindrales bacterium]|nr:hypothetical protein [Candidatus Limnocylindrales bacterium]
MTRIRYVFGLCAAALLIAAQPAFAASPVPSMDHEHGSGEAGSSSLSSPAAELRVMLDRLLAEHAFLTIEQMRSGLTHAPDLAAAAKAVEANSTDVAAAIGSIYGDAAIEPFGEIWRAHIGHLVDYAVAIGKDDPDAAEQAVDGLAVYRQRIAKFLTDANPGVDLGGITDALDMHTAQLIAFIDAEHQGDHAGAYDIEREAYPHMFHVGDALAKVIANRFPEEFSGVDVAYSAAGTLRVTLDRVLAEHAFLAAEVMRSGIANDPSFEAGAAAVSGNSADLEGLIGAAYNDAAAASFRKLWDSHITAYVEYIQAARANNAAGKAAATDQVDQYVAQIAGFLAGANPRFDANDLSAMFREHARHLITQVDAFEAADYDKSYAIMREGYSHMFDAGEALATGIAGQMPDKFPSDVAAPATDAMAGHGMEALPLLLVVLTALAGAATGAWALRPRSLRGRRWGSARRD